LEKTSRRPRADAERNRHKLLKATTELIAEGGELSLAAVAERAGVGIGTLYRHFPNRDALLGALYHGEVERLHGTGARLSKKLPPLDALKAWLDGYAALMAIKYGMADAMKAALRSDSLASAHSRALLREALSSLLAAAADAGAVRRDVDPQDVLMAVAANVSASLDTEGATARRRRLLDLLIDGLRFGATGSARSA
jgi:AcrR family transcriptional regulator